MAERFTAAIALGANVGEPERTFKRALNLLERDADVQILRRSHLVELNGDLPLPCRYQLMFPFVLSV